jgi:hypothetical protein
MSPTFVSIVGNFDHVLPISENYWTERKADSLFDNLTKNTVLCQHVATPTPDPAPSVRSTTPCPPPEIPNE